MPNSRNLDKLRLCLVPVKYFLENIYFPEMLFLGKKNVFKLFGCLKIRFTENQFRCLVRSNILRKMFYIAKPPNFPYTSSAVNMWKMNQYLPLFLIAFCLFFNPIPHSHFPTNQTDPQKKRNPEKKFIKSNQIERRRKRERRLGSI